MKEEKRLLVIVDMQNDFVDGALAAEGGKEALRHAQELVRTEQERGSEIVYTRDLHEENYLQTQEGKRLPVPHCIRGTQGAEFAKGIYMQGARVFEKNTFASTALGEYVKAEGFDKILLAGICTDICVISNALLIKAFCPEATVGVIANASAGTSKENHLSALRVMECCQIEIE